MRFIAGTKGLSGSNWSLGGLHYTISVKHCQGSMDGFGRHVLCQAEACRPARSRFSL
jgi:hypothetical protein